MKSNILQSDMRTELKNRLRKSGAIYPNIGQSWGIVGVLILSMGLFFPVYILLNNVLGKELSFLIYYLIAVGVSFGIVHWIRYKKTGINKYNFSLSSMKIMALVSISIIAIDIGIISPIANLLPMPEFMKEILIELAAQKGIFLFISMVIAAPFLEELIFRGIILNGLLRKYSPAKSIVISSLLFGIVHLNPWQFIAAFLGGLFSGWVYYRTRKLTLSIIIHLVNNLIVFVSAYFMDAESMITESLTEFYGSFINMILVITAAITVSIICVFILRKEFNKLEIGEWQPLTEKLTHRVVEDEN